MNNTEKENFVDVVIKENKLQNSAKNRNVIKMVLNSSKVKDLDNTEKMKYLKDNFLKK